MYSTNHNYYKGLEFSLLKIFVAFLKVTISPHSLTDSFVHSLTLPSGCHIIGILYYKVFHNSSQNLSVLLLFNLPLHSFPPSLLKERPLQMISMLQVQRTRKGSWERVKNEVCYRDAFILTQSYFVVELRDRLLRLPRLRPGIQPLSRITSTMCI